MELIVKKECSVTSAMKLKGGIDERESRSYFLNSIAPFEDIRGKRVIIKIDSGLCRMELGFLADARTFRCIIYPGKLNTHVVTQETN